MKPKQLQGKEVTHDHLGKCLVTNVPKGSKTKVEVVCIDRGKGWDEIKEEYIGFTRWFKDHTIWQRGQNYQYGHKDVVHVNSLTLN